MKLLIIDDEPSIVETVEHKFRKEGFSTFTADSAEEGMRLYRRVKPDLIILDIMLPQRSGLDFCRAVRKDSATPIIFISARADEADRVRGLELGADDYICKPFSPREVIARLKAVLRRSGPGTGTAASNDRPALVLDTQSLRVRAEHREESLTAVEFHLLEIMYREPGRVFSRSQLMDRMYSDRRIVSDRTIDSHVKKLRRKLAILVPDLELIHAVYGAGYRYEPRRGKCGVEPDPNPRR